jgi:hypothetical protein
MGKTQSKLLEDDQNGFNAIDKTLLPFALTQFLYFVFLIATFIVPFMKKYHDEKYLRPLTLLVFAISIVTLALISCYKTTYKKQWEEKTNLVNNILCETPGIKNKDLLNNKNLLLALIVIQAFTVAVMILLTGSITGKFCLPIGGIKKKTPQVDEKQSGGLLNSEEFLRTTE